MCLINFAYNSHPDFPLIVAANRDEFYQRPTKKAQFWDDFPTILAGRDLQQGGTWIGVSKTGNFAALTNVRELTQMENARTRGELVVNFLKENITPTDYLEKIKNKSNQYNGFNLLVGSVSSLYWFSNRDGRIFEVEDGIHSVSNAALNTPWPKVKKGKEQLQNCLKHDCKEMLIDCLLESLRVDTQAAQSELPDTGVGLYWEKILSPLFIKSENYGTRASTVILFGRNQNIHFLERSFIDHKTEDKVYQFTIER